MRGIKITQSITDRSDASLGIYFKDVSKQPMLTMEEEAELAKRIRDGDDLAAQELVKANLRFVTSVAKQYQNKGLSLVDLIQEGSIGMIKAAYKFDETRGFKFISYAVWWIRQAIQQALGSQSRTVRLPQSQINSIIKVNQVISKFEQEYGRKPSFEEIENETEIPADKVSFILSSINRSVSLETPFGEEDTGCLLDVLPNTNSEEADETIVKEGTFSEIEEVLSNLSPRESDVIRMSFGLGISYMSPEEIANRFGVSCERIRQIKHEAIERIKLNYRDLLKELL